MRRCVTFAVIGLVLNVAMGSRSASAADRKPNVLVIFVDDLGYADLSATGNRTIATPHMDSIAKNGVRFTDSYVTGCVCSPSRAGLLTGRYQQRFGFDANAEGERQNDREPRGLDLKQMTFAQHMKRAGYATGLVGKWHLGARAGYRPTERGFDEFYGLLPHGIGGAKEGEDVPIYRGTERVAVPEDHTVAFGNEARSFIEQHRDSPWFLYLAFTAVHSPHSAPESYLKKVSTVADKRQQKYFAMLACLDDAVGGVLATLRECNLEEDTLIFFASDNGGPQNVRDNGLFRGGKWSLWEGGIRSPIFIQWTGHIQPETELRGMVTQLDFLPTALAAAGVTIDPVWKLDGKNLLPWMQGQTHVSPHDRLFWRFGVQFAVRQGTWKLVKPSINQAPKLFDLAQDVGESRDLAAEFPERVMSLQTLWDAWNSKNEPPRWIDERWNGLEEKQDQKQQQKKKKKAKKG